MTDQAQEPGGAAGAGGDAAATATAGAAAAAAGGGQQQQQQQDAGQAAATGDANPWWGKPDLGLDQETADFYAKRNTPSLVEALKSGVHAHKAVTDRNVLAKPDPAKIGEWAGWKDLGWVEDRAAYKPASAKADAPEGYAYNDGLESTFLDACHAARVPVAAAEQVLKTVMGADFARHTETAASLARAEQEADQALRQKWGAQYGANKELAQRAFRTFGPENVDAATLDGLIGAPGMVELFQRIGAAMGEERLAHPGAGGGLGGRSKTTIQAEINLLQQQEGDALTNPRHQRHQEMNDKHRRLLDELAGVR